MNNTNKMFFRAYGLTVPKKGGGITAAPAGSLKPRLACFDEDSDSDTEKTKVERLILVSLKKSHQETLDIQIRNMQILRCLGNIKIIF
jgi:hypothetical protein